MTGVNPGDVGLLGLGAMGAPMARALVAAGLEPWVWNRTAAKAEPFAETGAHVAAAPADAARPVTLTVLADLPDLEEVVDRPDGLLAGWRAAGVAAPVLVVMGTVSPTGVRQLGARLAGHGVRVSTPRVRRGCSGAEATPTPAASDGVWSSAPRAGGSRAASAPSVPTTP
ncbi:NAD(P)-binding domain-containing protein [Georgenia sp. SUBG003]|uniref:NAD(P)-binding domain-containing protein n=1 Tax=Georgenia sp. SUBG003 TaxID=1497974 RepID=UPI003AB756C2